MAVDCRHTMLLQRLTLTGHIKQGDPGRDKYCNERDG
jgi:hypothetical protein